MRNVLAPFAIFAAIWSAPAAAAWNVAQSKHFVVYSQDNPKDLREFATKLERFDQAARLAISMDDPEIGKGNRLTIFMLPSVSDVQAIRGDKSGWLAGFYTGRVSGSLVNVPRELANPDADPEGVFFHEYTHHLMMQDQQRPYPEWYVEGFAEFLSTAKVNDDGSVSFGAPLQKRANTLLNGAPMPFAMMATGIKPNFTNEQKDEFYARGWLLAHYLQMTDKRQGQLTRYLNALAAGAQPLDAAQQAFGDLKQLDKELDQYTRQRFAAFRLPAARIQVGNIDIQPLTEGGAAVIMARAKVKYGQHGPAAEALAAQVRQIEARYPGDDLVESTLAQAELEAGHPAAAQAAADRALKASTNDVEAMIYKGIAIEDQAPAEHGPARQAAFDQARQLFIAANKIDTEDPEPLINFFRSYVRQGIRPTDNALAALHYASDLAPQDLSVRMASAVAYINEGKIKDARSTLVVVAYAPHDNVQNELAKKMIVDIDKGEGRLALQELRPAAQAATPPN